MPDCLSHTRYRIIDKYLIVRQIIFDCGCGDGCDRTSIRQTIQQKYRNHKDELGFSGRPTDLNATRR